MKSITSKLSIIILSLLASSYTFAFGHGDVCKALNDALSELPEGEPYSDGLPYYGPITDIYSRNTNGSDPRGEVFGTVGGWPDRLSSQSGLECSGKTCHVNKKWDDCACTKSNCETASQSAADKAATMCWSELCSKIQPMPHSQEFPADGNGGVRQTPL